MQRHLQRFVLPITVLCAIGTAATQTVRVGIIGDQTGTDDLRIAYEVLEAGARLIATQNVAAVLHTGDLIESSYSETEVRADFDRATAILNSIGALWHLTPGDHDVNPPEFVRDSTDRSRETLFRTLYQRQEP